MGQNSRQTSSQSSDRLSSQLWPWFVAAGALGGFALLRRTKTSAAMAGAGLWVARRAARQTTSRSYSAECSFAVNCTPEQAYGLWRKMDQVARYLRHVDSVIVLDDKHSEWTVLGPLDRKFRWISEITEDRLNERIAWQSVAGSVVETRGAIEFRPRTAGRGTDVVANLSYTLPAGTATQALLAVSGRNPQFTLREDLRRFKSLLEAGEVPTVAGQSHGPRGIRGRLDRMVLREPVNATPPQAPSASRIA